MFTCDNWMKKTYLTVADVYDSCYLCLIFLLVVKSFWKNNCRSDWTMSQDIRDKDGTASPEADFYQLSLCCKGEPLHILFADIFLRDDKILLFLQDTNNLRDETFLIWDGMELLCCK